jgi:hypothetical protein
MYFRLMLRTFHAAIAVVPAAVFLRVGPGGLPECDNIRRIQSFGCVFLFSEKQQQQRPLVITVQR